MNSEWQCTALPLCNSSFGGCWRSGRLGAWMSRRLTALSHLPLAFLRSCLFMFLSCHIVETVDPCVILVQGPCYLLCILLLLVNSIPNQALGSGSFPTILKWAGFYLTEGWTAAGCPSAGSPHCSSALLPFPKAYLPLHHQAVSA